MIKIDLSELVKSPETNSISGRSFGEKFAVSKKLLDHVQQNEKILIVIDDSKVKAINDSFIKGFFSQVFEKLKTREKVKCL